MSEHMRIEGEISFDHLPYGDVGSFAYCLHCKETCDKIEIGLHEGIEHNWIRVKCGKCKKTIWISKLKMKLIRDNKKCAICGKATNDQDAFSCNNKYGSMKDEYTCSKVCDDKWNDKEKRPRRG